MMEFIEERISRVTESGCWIWTGFVHKSGYALGHPEKKTVRIHRWLFIKERGDIGDLVLDHLCRVRCCVNPDHLEPVTTRENIRRGVGPTARNARKIFCPRGHLLTGVSIHRTRGAGRYCLVCKNAARTMRRKAARAAIAQAQQGEEK